MAYDPAFAYEIAVIIREGIRRMYEKQESIFYYLTVGNENYPMPEMPGDVKEGILKGMYRFKTSSLAKKVSAIRAHLFGSGAIMNEVVKAQQILEEKYKVATDIWSVTSYKCLYRDALDTERWNLLHPEQKAKVPYVTQCLAQEKGVFVASSDYMKTLPLSIAKWVPGKLTALGTDGFGRSESRSSLRDFFEVDAKHIVFATLVDLFKEGEIKADALKKATKDLGINSEKINPMIS